MPQQNGQHSVLQKGANRRPRNKTGSIPCCSCTTLLPLLRFRKLPLVRVWLPAGCTLSGQSLPQGIPVINHVTTLPAGCTLSGQSLPNGIPVISDRVGSAVLRVPCPTPRRRICFAESGAVFRVPCPTTPQVDFADNHFSDFRSFRFLPKLPSMPVPQTLELLPMLLPPSTLLRGRRHSCTRLAPLLKCSFNRGRCHCYTPVLRANLSFRLLVAAPASRWPSHPSLGF